MGILNGEVSEVSKNRLIGIIIFFGLIVLVVSIVRGMFYYKKFGGSVGNDTNEGWVKDIKMSGASEDGTRWELLANLARVQNQRVEIEGFSLVYYGGGREVKITSVRSVYSQKEAYGTAIGNVSVNLYNGTLKTERLVWYTKRGEFCIPDNFVYSSDRAFIVGSDACYKVRGERLEIRNLKKVVMK